MKCFECGRDYRTYDGLYHHTRERHPAKAAGLPSPTSPDVRRVPALPVRPAARPSARQRARAEARRRAAAPDGMSLAVTDGEDRALLKAAVQGLRAGGNEVHDDMPDAETADAVEKLGKRVMQAFDEASHEAVA